MRSDPYSLNNYWLNSTVMDTIIAPPARNRTKVSENWVKVLLVRSLHAITHDASQNMPVQYVDEELKASAESGVEDGGRKFVEVKADVA